MILGPDSRARLAIEAAGRLRTLGAGVPWALVPPLPPLLVAVASLLPGVTAEAAWLGWAAVGWLAAAGALLRLWRTWGAPLSLGLQAAALALVAPSAWIAVLERGELERLLFWKLPAVALLALDAFRRRPTWATFLVLPLAPAAMLLSRSSRWIGFDLLALAEWAVIAAVCWPWSRPSARRTAAALAAGVVFVAAGWTRLAGRAADAMPEGLALGAREAGLGAVIGPVSLDAELHPFAKQVHELIVSETRPAESVLWLRALGAGTLVARAGGAYATQYECVERRGEWCLFETPPPAPPAVLVSRERFAALAGPRGLLDAEGLEQYIHWASRPEAVGFREDGAALAVEADAGPGDLILARRPAADVRRAERSRGDGPFERVEAAADPLGFTVLDPGGAGRVRFRLERGGSLWPPPLRRQRLDPEEYPRIRPDGIVEARAFTPSPFAPSAYVTIFGERFGPGATLVLLDGRSLEPLWTGEAQINLQLPADLAAGAHEFAVEADGRRSFPHRFEVAP